MATPYPIPIPELGALIAEELRQGLTVRFTVRGLSMLPSLQTGDVVEVAPARAEEVQVGGIVVAWVGEGALAVHRVVAAGGRGTERHFVLWPEASDQVHGPVPASSLLGRVVTAERNGQPLALARPIPAPVRWMARGVLLQRLRPSLWPLLRPGARFARRAGRGMQRAARHAIDAFWGVPLTRQLLRSRRTQLHQQLEVRRMGSRGPSGDESWHWVAAHRRRRAGSVSLSPAFGALVGKRSWWLSGLWVEPGHRRRGIGERLVRELLAAAEAHGIPEVWAAVRHDNRASVALHESAGFERVEDADLESVVSRHYEEVADWPPGTLTVMRRISRARDAMDR